jgi:hypothetical protein
MQNLLHVKYQLLLLNFNETLIFSTNFSKKSQISDLIKVRPVGAELLQADRQADGRR